MAFDLLENGTSWFINNLGSKIPDPFLLVFLVVIVIMVLIAYVIAKKKEWIN